MMKNMSPEQINELMAQAKNQQQQMTEQIKQIVQEEIKKQNLISKKEVEQIINSLSQGS